MTCIKRSESLRKLSILKIGAITYVVGDDKGVVPT